MKQQAEIVDTIAKHLGVTPADIELDASLAEDLGLSPIEIADLLSVFSQKYQITFDPSDTEGLRTVNDIVVLIEDLLLE